MAMRARRSATPAVASRGRSADRHGERRLPASATRSAGWASCSSSSSRSSTPSRWCSRHYRKEVWRLIAEVTFGGGLLAVAASTILVSALLASVVGVQLGIEGLQGLNIIGLAPLAGLLSAFANTRELSPLLAGYGLAAQMGCRFTAQLGAMRVNEEIDALEVMSIPALPYLITTRLLAALIAVIPMYLLALSGAYLATQLRRDRHRPPGVGHLPPLLLPLPRPQGRLLFGAEGGRLRDPGHDHPLLLRHHGNRAGRRASGRAAGRAIRMRPSSSRSPTCS